MLPAGVALALGLVLAVGGPLRVEVVDGDTVRPIADQNATFPVRSVRLVGYDSPERGRKARCEAERALAETAAARLAELVGDGAARLEAVPCACRPGTEGTPACNHGRACGRLTVAGRDVGEILIREGLARPYVCGPARCPRRAGWCG